MKNIEELQDTVEQATETELEQLWRERHDLRRNHKIRASRIIEKECETRYTGFSAKPLTVKIPFFHQLVPMEIRKVIERRVDAQDWPLFLREWTKRGIRLHTESRPKVEEILTNVTAPWRPHGKCACADCPPDLPKVNGHVFFISRDYHGPHEVALRVWGGTTSRDRLGGT